MWPIVTPEPTQPSDGQHAHCPGQESVATISEDADENMA